MLVEKAIVTNVEALRSKYGPRHRDVLAAMRALVLADARRGVASRVFDLSSPASMARADAAAVAGPGDRRGAKDGVDAIDFCFAPQYVLLVGAADVVPMQRFARPLDRKGDPLDADGPIDSDLPYACDEPHGRGLAAYVGATRVVGRLPDVPGADDPSFLLSMLAHAARARTRPREDYERAFALSAQDWLLASRELLERVYGRVRRHDLHLSPGHGPRPWGREALSPRLHYLNCHGGAFAAHLQGALEGASLYREMALHSRELEGKIRPGTVMVTEACFGAHVYDPSLRRAEPGGGLPIALRYLGQGASGVFGSASTTYGGEDRVRGCGSLCEHFLRRLLAGASLGRAVLEARHAFVSAWHGSPDPLQLKTLAQFSLLGDPSIHPVRMEHVAPIRGSRGGFTARQARAFRTQARRENLRYLGLALREDFPEIVEMGNRRERERAVRGAARLLGVKPGARAGRLVRVFELRRPRMGQAQTSVVRHVAMNVMQLSVDRFEAVVAQLEDGRVVSNERYVTR